MSELVGNLTQLQGLLQWFKSWKTGIPEFRAVLLLGPPGVGKTASVGALTNDLDGELVEFNASDKRNKAHIETQVWLAATQQTLDGSIRIILLDEVDGLSGTSDRGGVGAILKVIESTVHPIVMTANDPNSPRLKELVKRCRIFRFEPISAEDMLKVLKRIEGEQEHRVGDEALSEIIERSAGDLRAAISDLELFIKGGFDLELASRDIRRNIEETLRRLFMTTDITTARRVLSESDVDHDTLLLWLEENLHLHLMAPEELEKGLESLALADLYLGRIWKGQNWRLLAYVYDLMSTGMATSRFKTPFRRVEYSQPSWPLLVWRGNMNRQKQASVLGRLARITGVSRWRAARSHQDAIERIVSRSPRFEKHFTDWLGVRKGSFGQRRSR
jgi:replication factor C large subunit